MKRSWWISLALLLVVLAGLGGGLYALLTYEPPFYRDAVVTAGPARLEASRDFETRAAQLINDVQYSNTWKFSCTAEQFNSYLVEDFLKSNLAKLVPDQLHDMRVQFLPDEIQVGFKYGRDRLQTIVSLRLKVWLPQKEPNALVVEVMSLQAGAMPIAVKALQEEFAEQLRGQGIKALWYRKDGHPTVILKFQADRREPSFHFKHLEITPGKFYLEGLTLDPEAPKRAVEGILPAGAP
jgi:hypothetical protein